MRKNSFYLPANVCSINGGDGELMTGGSSASAGPDPGIAPRQDLHREILIATRAAVAAKRARMNEDIEPVRRLEETTQTTTTTTTTTATPTAGVDGPPPIKSLGGLSGWSSNEQLKTRSKQLGAPIYGDKDVLWKRLQEYEHRASAELAYQHELTRAAEERREAQGEHQPGCSWHRRRRRNSRSRRAT